MMKVLKNETIKYIYLIRDSKDKNTFPEVRENAKNALETVYTTLIKEGYNKEQLDFIFYGDRLHLI